MSDPIDFGDAIEALEQRINTVSGVKMSRAEIWEAEYQKSLATLESMPSNIDIAPKNFKK